MKHSLLKKKKRLILGVFAASQGHLARPPPSLPSSSLPTPSLPSFFASHSQCGSHTADIELITSQADGNKKKAACSVLRMTYLGGGTIRACVTARVHTCKPCLARGASSPWLKLSSFAPLMTPWHMLRKSEGLSTTERRASVCVCVSQN